MAKTKREKGFRDKILRVTSRLIIKKGVAQTSLSDIAKAISISPGTLYYYFPSKNDLIFEICNMHIERISNRMLRIVEVSKRTRNPTDILESVLKVFISSKDRIGEIHLYLIQEALVEQRKLAIKFKHAYHEWMNKINSVAKEYFDEESKQTLVRIVITLIDGLLIQFLLGIDPPNYRKISAFLLDSKQNAGARSLPAT